MLHTGKEKDIALDIINNLTKTLILMKTEPLIGKVENFSILNACKTISIITENF